MMVTPIRQESDVRAPQSRAEAIVSCSGVSKVFGKGSSEVLALRGIDLSIYRGEFLAIMGPSGCGKSTLLHVLSGIEPPTAGHVILEGHNLQELDDTRRSVLRRRRIGFV